MKHSLRAQPLGDKKLTVIHSVSRWLTQTETWLYGQIKSLPSPIESHVVCNATENLDQFSLPNIHRFLEAPTWRQYWDKGLRKLRIRRHSGFLVVQARRYHAQILHSHFGNIGWINIGAARQSRLKHVVTFYGIDVNRLPQQDPRWYKRYRTLFDTVDRVLCEGPHMAQCIVNLGCPEHKVLVHHLGVGVDAVTFTPREWNYPEPLRVLIAASFKEKKGVCYALEALGMLQHEVPLEITVIGDANREARSQSEKQRILAAIDKYGLQSKIRLLGYQPHDAVLAEAYKHHVFLSPSVTAADGDTEGGAPVSIIEMAATGMPIISTTHCDIPMVIQNGITGLLAAERDVGGLLRHLKWLLEHPDQWTGIVEAGRRHVEVEFDARVQGERLAAIYRELDGS